MNLGRVLSLNETIGTEGFGDSNGVIVPPPMAPSTALMTKPLSTAVEEAAMRLHAAS